MTRDATGTQTSPHRSTDDAKHLCRFPDGNPRAVLQSAVEALDAGRRPVLAIVVDTEGSTYAARATLALFGDGPRVGWISGGCLEPEIARAAATAHDTGAIEWLDIDTSDDAALFSGAAVGCRGRQLLVLLPLAVMPDIAGAARGWLEGGHTLRIKLQSDGTVDFSLDGRAWRWTLPIGNAPTGALRDWRLQLPQAPEALILGAGPETPTLAPLLQSLGWRVAITEHRARWREAAAMPMLDLAAEDAVAAFPNADVALVMHHGFEADRDALAALAHSRVPCIGLLGPERRREDLFKLLRSSERDALIDRLHSPVGMPGCGRGPEAIALSIATQLQQWRGAQRA